MSDRLIQIVVPTDRAARVTEILGSLEAAWSRHADTGEQTGFSVIVPAESVEAVLDPIQTAVGSDYRLVVLKVEASLPKRREEATDGHRHRVSRDELVTELTGSARAGVNFYVGVVLSAIVAAIGLYRDNVAVIIGAMVIAPLLGPNMAFAMATTLADRALARRALRTLLKGLVLAFGLSCLAGYVWPVDTSIGEVASRANEVDFTDIVLALAAGWAGAMSFTAGLSSSLVGVMVAVALLPPLTAFAMLLVSGDWSSAAASAVLLATNVICVNVAAVATFVAWGVSPRTSWELKLSRREIRRSMAIWAILAVAVMLLRVASHALTT